MGAWLWGPPSRRDTSSPVLLLLTLPLCLLFLQHPLRTLLLAAAASEVNVHRMLAVTAAATTTIIAATRVVLMSERATLWQPAQQGLGYP